MHKFWDAIDTIRRSYPKYSTSYPRQKVCKYAKKMSYTRSYPRYPQKDSVEKVGLHSIKTNICFVKK